MWTVVLTQTAREDLEHLVAFIEETQSNRAKTEFLNAFSERLLRLEHMPLIYQASEKVPGVRRCLIHKHAACFYEVRDELVIILSVIDTRMDDSKSPY